jgi:hypothetical protein
MRYGLVKGNVFNDIKVELKGVGGKIKSAKRYSVGLLLWD